MMTTTTLNDLHLGKIFGGCDAFGSIPNVPTWACHDGALLGNDPLLCLVGQRHFVADFCRKL